MKFSKLSTLVLAFLLAFGIVMPAEANIFNLLRQKKEHHRHQNHRNHDHHRDHDEFNSHRGGDNHHGRDHRHSDRHSRRNFDRRGHGRNWRGRRY